MAAKRVVVNKFPAYQIPAVDDAIPKDLAEAADKLYTVRTQRLAAQKALENLAEVEKKLNTHLIDTLPVSKAEGITGQLVHAEITKSTIPVIENADVFFKFANRKGNEDLFKRVMVQSAVQERWKDNKPVPGIGTFVVKKVSLTKPKSKRGR